ncbi:MAG: lamin tail domain-containing protein, partial [Oscillospiraceae bacterium]|nr:lamin tail domain-containing protein [Oscillospiraceae bacterium]
MKNALRQGPLILLLLLCAVFLCFCVGLKTRRVSADDQEPVSAVPSAERPMPHAEMQPLSAARPTAAVPTEEELRLQDALRISEAMPSNGVTLFDEDGDSSDWVELVNISDDPVSLENCWLSDKERNRMKWQLPALELAGGERLIIFCSKKDRTEGEYHSSFSLSKAGGEILLSS